MEPHDPPDGQDGLTDEERATLEAGGRLVDDQQPDDDEEPAPSIEGPNSQ